MKFHYSIEVAERTGQWRTHNTEMNGYRVEYDRLPDSAIGDVITGERGDGEGSLTQAVDTMISVVLPYLTRSDVVCIWSLTYGEKHWIASDWAETNRAVLVLKSITSR